MAAGADGFQCARLSGGLPMSAISRAAGFVAVAATVLVATACGSGSTTSSSGTAASQQIGGSVTVWAEWTGAEQQAFLASYEKELEFRIRQGGRGLFFLSQERTRVGIANVYIGHGDRGYLPRPVVALYEPSCMLSRRGSDKGLENVYVCFRMRDSRSHQHWE